ncbi:MAG: YheU family protein [Reinekea forsetii]|nr:YheU family protein [Reinekea forsetii]MDO7645662.1 YheU family protein [Reinekea forsetii]
MIIPHERLAPEVLSAVIEDWLSRQSQDWVGDIEDRDQVVEQVIEQMRRKKLVVTWDDESQTINLVDAEAVSILPTWPVDEFNNG